MKADGLLRPQRPLAQEMLLRDLHGLTNGWDHPRHVLDVAQRAGADIRRLQMELTALRARTKDRPMQNDAIAAALRLLTFHGNEPLAVEYDNDVGPNDEGFWEWWSVGGVRFTSEEHANAFCDLLKAARSAKGGA